MRLPRSFKERFGVRATAQAPPTYDSASAGMVENAIRQKRERREREEREKRCDHRRVQRVSWTEFS